jgi:hypothetical protein
MYSHNFEFGIENLAAIRPPVETLISSPIRFNQFMSQLIDFWTHIDSGMTGTIRQDVRISGQSRENPDPSRTRLQRRTLPPEELHSSGTAGMELAWRFR